MGQVDIAFIVGTRPEAIKIWPVILEAQRQGIGTYLISTNQQRHLLAQTFKELDLSADATCNIFNDSGDISTFLSGAILNLVEFLKNTRPKVVIVQGDTGSALAGAIAAHNLQIPVGHIEAGLRSGDLGNPWPEEGNRRLIDSISSFLWCPTPGSEVPIQNDQVLEVVGNTSIDALRLSLGSSGISRNANEKYILVTLHRRESFGETMVKSLREIVKFADKTKIPILFIEHPNPRVREALNEVVFPIDLVQIIAPVPYKKFISLLAKSRMVISDSGGIQEEATALGIPLVVVREKTERHEIFSENREALVGSSGETLLSTGIYLLEKSPPKQGEAKIENKIFGDGYTSERIIRSLVSHFNFDNSKVE